MLIEQYITGGRRPSTDAKQILQFAVIRSTHIWSLDSIYNQQPAAVARSTVEYVNISEKLSRILFTV